MSVSLLEAKANFVEWCKSFLNTHVDYKKDMPFDIDFVAKAIWKKIENSYENLLYLEEQNVALRGEADTNAALSIKHKMLAYELKAENAALRSGMQYLIDDGGADCCARCIYCPQPTEKDDDCDCRHKGDCVDGMIKWFERQPKELQGGKE